MVKRGRDGCACKCSDGVCPFGVEAQHRATNFIPFFLSQRAQNGRRVLRERGHRRVQPSRFDKLIVVGRGLVGWDDTVRGHARVIDCFIEWAACAGQHCTSERHLMLRCKRAGFGGPAWRQPSFVSTVTRVDDAVHSCGKAAPKACWAAFFTLAERQRSAVSRPLVFESSSRVVIACF